jgi:phosphatidylinositol-bisphosphatase
LLILRIEDGKDFFLVISGNYIPTCFGMSLEKLAKIKSPVHSANKARQAEPGTRSPSPEASQNGTVPKEIWRMLNFLWNRNMLELVSMVPFIPLVIDLANIILFPG